MRLSVDCSPNFEGEANFSTLAVLRFGRQSALVGGALLSEELFQQLRCLAFAYTMLDNRVVIEPRIATHVVQT
jgi:hypothetical protein